MKHPQRYPQHDGDKGTVFGGECNRSACLRFGADWFNTMTYGYYCQSCAQGINFQDQICVHVTGPLNLYEMDKMHAEAMKTIPL